MVTPAAPLRIVFFGTPDFAVPTLQRLNASRHSIVGVVTQPDRGRGRGQLSQPSPVKQFALEQKLKTLQPERMRDEQFLESLQALDADLGVVAAYGNILTDSVLAMPRLGLINVHASLLPKYRGAAPVHRAIMAGETVTGVTIMRIVKALDAGPMIAAVSRPIDPDETSVEVEADLARIGAKALVESVEAIAEGRATEMLQDDSRATYAHKLEKIDGIVDWSKSAAAIHNQIRGLHPWPHAVSDLDGERTILLKSEVEGEAHQRSGPPGMVLEAHGDRLAVQTGDGILRILTLQREGRRPMSARDFLTGRRLQAGARFDRSHSS